MKIEKLQEIKESPKQLKDDNNKIYDDDANTSVMESDSKFMSSESREGSSYQDSTSRDSYENADGSKSNGQETKLEDDVEDIKSTETAHSDFIISSESQEVTEKRPKPKNVTNIPRTIPKQKPKSKPTPKSCRDDFDCPK